MWQDTSSVLFSAQRLDRIDKCRAARGQITGEQGYECEKQRDGDKGNRIGCLHAEKKVGQNARKTERARQTDTDADERECQRANLRSTRPGLALEFHRGDVLEMQTRCLATFALPHRP